MKKIIIICLCVIAVLIVSCTTIGEAESLKQAVAQDFPRVDGSSSAFPLQSVLACTVLDVDWQWSADEKKNVLRKIIPLTTDDRTKQAETVLAIKHNGTHGAYVNLINNKTDIILVARDISPDEIAEAKEKGVELDIRPVALDAFVFMAHVSNPVEGLTTAQLKDVYAGKTKLWEDVGIQFPVTEQSLVPINAYQRERNSGSQELMQTNFMKDIQAIDAPSMIRLTMLGPFNAIGGDRFTGEGGDEYGLAYTVYYYAAEIFPHEKVKMLAVDGVFPDSENIAARRYPYVAEVYVCIRKDMPADSSTVKFRDWMFTLQGQSAVEKSGYVKL